jgi:hypothetical protein
MRFIARLLSYLFSFVLVGISAYAFYTAYARFENPCLLPITYRIDTFDTKFGITKGEFLNSIKKSEEAWEKKSGVNLFDYDAENGRVALNLVYDTRQYATDKLDDLNNAIDTSKDSYESVKAQYDATNNEYKTALSAYNTASSEYESKRQAYQERVKYWNEQGGAPEEEYKKLSQEKAALVTMQADLTAKRDAINALVAKVNAQADKLNKLAKKLNININQYNTIGTLVDKEFDQGIYERDASGEKITVFQFDDMPTLIHVLTHEFGHALQLEHNQDKSSIMYYLHENEAQIITDADIEALKNTCKIK